MGLPVIDGPDFGANRHAAAPSPGAHPLPQSTSVTIVVPTRDRGALLSGTVYALLATASPDTEILIVDQSTAEASRDAARSLAHVDPRVRAIPTDTIGSSAARNLGAALSTADVVAYCDDDCIVDPGWEAAVAAEFRDPSVFGVFGRLLPYEAQPRTGTEVGYKPSRRRTTYTRPVPPWHVGHGGSMAFRRLEMLAIGGFDPLLGAGCLFGACEDADMAYRLLAAGRKVVYCPNALSYHKHWKSWPAQKAMERAYGVGAGAQFAKYLRCGDPYGAVLFVLWCWQLGVRRVAAGTFKWRNARVVYLGYCQLVFPWVGLVRSRRMSIARKNLLYEAVQ